MEAGCIVVLASDGAIYERFGSHLSGCGHRVVRCDPSPGPAAAVAAAEACDAVLAADMLPTPDGIAMAAEQFPFEHIPAPVVVIATHADMRRAVASIQAGAADYFTMAEDPSVIAVCIGHILKQKKNRTNDHQRCHGGEEIPVARSDAMRSLLAMARRVAPSQATVLIQGESGTGKELLARYIHRHSGRGEHPLVAMNCAALPDTLAESELFGYERGAFTGAVQRKAGKFELAHAGTLLLDEVSEMPLALQAKLLRVLQEKEVDRIGARRPVPVDVRVIATTNRDLARMVRDGQFRQDLYYRLRIVPLIIPPLRSRTEDIPELTDHFLRKHHGGADGPLPGFNAAAMDALMRWAWPGNARELENTVQRALLIRNGDRMGPEHLLLEEGLAPPGVDGETSLVGMTVKALEERLIAETLTHVNQNRTQAADMLGISIRTLRNKLREYREFRPES